MSTGRMLTVGIILYPRLVVMSLDGQPVTSAAGIRVEPDHCSADHPELDVLLVPGGPGARQLVNDNSFLGWLSDVYYGRQQHQKLEHLLSVCTGSAVLAKSGLLDERTATSNNQAFDWVRSQSESTIWVKRARWVEDGNIITSSGVSAGMDMTMFFINKIAGPDVASQVAAYTEYDGQWTNPRADNWA